MTIPLQDYFMSAMQKCRTRQLRIVRKKIRELHCVKSEEFKCQKANIISKKNDLREHQQQNSLDGFKDASWIN